VSKVKKNKISKKVTNKVSEPQAVYGTSIQFFSSHDEQEDFHRRQMAGLTPRELLDKLEEMRKIFLKEYLLQDGTWPFLKRIITFKKANPL